MGPTPLAGSVGTAASWPAAQEAGRLLSLLGADVQDGGDPAVSLGPVKVDARPSDAAEDWAKSGVADLTGRPNGPLLMPAGRPATFARGVSLAIRAVGGTVEDGASLLGMRVGIIDLRRGGHRAANGHARLLRCGDGWFALNLPRTSDLDLVPALVQSELDTDHWTAVENWARSRTGTEIATRAADLGLATAVDGEAFGTPPWSSTVWPGPRRERSHRPRVVNLGSLWAAPLAARILGESGADVVHVDTGRSSQTPAAWQDLLTRGHRTVRVDPSTAEGRDALRSLLTDADVVLEASRPRALHHLGVDAETIMRDGASRVWVRITGHPRDTERIAFGDDAAVAGGLVAADDHGPVFVGDAVADPLTGLVAALCALAALRDGRPWVTDVIMSGVAASAASHYRNPGESV